MSADPLDEVPVEELRRWREAFERAGYTSEGVVEMLGPDAHAALDRAETVPARRRTASLGPVETLVRLFLLQLPVPARAAEAALPASARAVLLHRDGDEQRARVDVRPHLDDLYVVSDLGTGLDGVHRPLPAEHVLGVGSASTTLSSLTVRHEVGRAADVGTGSGVQALQLATHAREVVATDVLPRALSLARASAVLSDLSLDLRLGSLLEPLAEDRYDLLVSNPPFVIGAASPHTYRDSGLPGDELCARLVRGAARHLAEGGWCQLLVSWVHERGGDWQERVRGWLPDGVDAWVVQREVADPATYVGVWLRDSGEIGSPGYLASYDAWLDGLERAGVEGLGFGWISMRRTGAEPRLRIEDWPHAVDQPLGDTVLRWARATDWLRGRTDADLLAARLVVAADVVQETTGQPGAEDPAYVVLRQQGGMRRAERVDTATAALVGACDGSLPVGALVDAVAELLEEDPPALRSRMPALLRRLVEEGLLRPAGGD